jgi:hypothetical protein
MFDIVGDIDFCEYFRLDDSSGFDRLQSNMDGHASLACLKLAFGRKVWDFPWGPDRPNKHDFISGFDSSDEDKATMKADYVGEVNLIGFTEISNLIIALDQNGKSAGLARTFAAQEAPLSFKDFLPNQMDDPTEMGRYIDFLIHSIESLKEKDVRKCLKRCASLARVSFLHEISDNIAKLAADCSAVLLSHKLSEHQKLVPKFRALSDERSVQLLGSLERNCRKLLTDLETRGGEPNESVLERFDTGAKRVASQLLDQFPPVKVRDA